MNSFGFHRLVFYHILSIKNAQVIKLILPVMVSPCYTAEVVTEGGKFLFIIHMQFLFTNGNCVPVEFFKSLNSSS